MKTIQTISLVFLLAYKRYRIGVLQIILSKQTNPFKAKLRGIMPIPTLFSIAFIIANGLFDIKLIRACLNLSSPKACFNKEPCFVTNCNEL